MVFKSHGHTKTVEIELTFSTRRGSIPRELNGEVALLLVSENGELAVWLIDA